MGSTIAMVINDGYRRNKKRPRYFGTAIIYNIGNVDKMPYVNSFEDAISAAIELGYTRNTLDSIANAGSYEKASQILSNARATELGAELRSEKECRELKRLYKKSNW